MSVAEYRVEKFLGEQPVDEDEMRRQMIAEGFDVYAWTDRPGAVYGPHSHADFQSHWIISGTLELTVTGTGTFVLQPGDRDLMPAGTEHYARVIGSEPVRYLIGSRTR